MASTDDVKRAEAGVRITQLKFKQALKKDNQVSPAVSLDSSSQFCDHLNAVFQQNTPEHVQTCKDWILTYITPSKTRIVVLGDYLVAVSRSIITKQASGAVKGIRNRLDILLVLNDVFHAEKHHKQAGVTNLRLAVELQPYLAELVELVCHSVDGGSKHAKKLQALINAWAARSYIDAPTFGALREQAAGGDLRTHSTSLAKKRTYTLPEWFGDRSVPWHELPASYMLESLIKYPERPINPATISVRRLDRTQPAERVRALLDNYFENIDLQYTPTGDNPTGETRKYQLWLDPLGQLVKKNKETGLVSTVSNGYGWSKDFCRAMTDNSVPDKITEARQEWKERMQTEETQRREEEVKALQRRVSPSLSPQRRKRSSSSRSYGRSHSNSSSASYDRHRSQSRGNNANNQYERRRFSSRGDHDQDGRRGRLEHRNDTGNVKIPPEPRRSNDGQDARPRWDASDHSNDSSYKTRPDIGAGYGRGFSVVPPVNQGTFVPPPPPPPPPPPFAPGQMQGFQPPPFGIPPPPPPPPGLFAQGSGPPFPFAPPPMMGFAGFPGMPANANGHQLNVSNQGGSRAQYGDGQLAAQSRGSFQGSTDERGAYHNQQGRGGWNSGN